MVIVPDGGERYMSLPFFAPEYALAVFGLGTLQRVVKEIRADVASARDRDPAARGVGTAEIL